MSLCSVAMQLDCSFRCFDLAEWIRARTNLVDVESPLADDNAPSCEDLRTESESSIGHSYREFDSINFSCLDDGNRGLDRLISLWSGTKSDVGPLS